MLILYTETGRTGFTGPRALSGAAQCGRPRMFGALLLKKWADLPDLMNYDAPKTREVYLQPQIY